MIVVQTDKVRESAPMNIASNVVDDEICVDANGATAVRDAEAVNDNESDINLDESMGNLDERLGEYDASSNRSLRKRQW